MWALAVGIAFTLLGAWMAAPFAGLEVLAIGLLCVWFYRHLDDCELITVDANRLHIMKRHGNRVVHHDFARAWVRVHEERPPDSNRPGRLLVGSHGRLVSLADEISEGDRAVIAHALRRMLSFEA